MAVKAASAPMVHAILYLTGNQSGKRWGTSAAMAVCKVMRADQYIDDAIWKAWTSGERLYRSGKAVSLGPRVRF